jgi:hypothetical protein
MRITEISRVAALAVALAMPALSIALAEAPDDSFNGQWVVDVPPSPVIAGESESVCPALRLPIRIEQGRLAAELAPVPTSTGGIVIETGDGPDAAPLMGEVGPDGTLDARWHNFHAVGKLSGDTGVITVETECGPATATAVRVSR